MFGINKKIYFVFSLIFAIAGVTVLTLKVINVLPQDELYSLLSVVLMLTAFAIYLNPKMKIMKKTSEYCQKFREEFYLELTKDPKYKDKIDITRVDFEENDEGVICFKNFKFDYLKYEEAVIIIKSLLKDFVMIVYGIEDEKKRISKAKICDFSVSVKRKDGKTYESKLIDNYMFVK